MEHLINNFIENKILSSFLIFIIRIILIVFIAHIIKTALIKISNNYFDKRKTKHSETLKGVSESFIKYLVFIVGLSAILELFGISFTSLVAVAGIGSVAIGFGAQSLVKDIITGAFILFEDQFKVGDYIEVNNKGGTVEKIGLRTTLIRNGANNALYIIPNSDITVVTNYSKDFQRARVDFLVPYETNLEYLSEVLEKNLQVLNNDKRIISKFNVISATSFADSGINMRISCDTLVGSMWAVERDIRKIVKETLEKENIEIPFNSQTIYIKK